MSASEKRLCCRNSSFSRESPLLNSRTKKVSFGMINHAQQFWNRRMAEIGKDHRFMVVFLFVFLPHTPPEALQDHRVPFLILRQVADAVTAAAKPRFDRIVSYPPQNRHQPILCPHSRQNLEPAGICFPHSGQKSAAFIFCPQDIQNLELAGTAVPQFGHTVAPVFCKLFCCCGLGCGCGW